MLDVLLLITVSKVNSMKDVVLLFMLII